jgi:hypothetical protein
MDIGVDYALRTWKLSVLDLDQFVDGWPSGEVDYSVWNKYILGVIKWSNNSYIYVFSYYLGF